MQYGSMVERGVVNSALTPPFSENDFPANALKGHGRKYAALAFVNFRADFPGIAGATADSHFQAIVQWLIAMEPRLTFAQQQREQQDRNKSSGEESCLTFLGISRKGMQRLGLSLAYKSVLGDTIDIAAYSAAYTHVLDGGVGAADIVVQFAHNDLAVLKAYVAELEKEIAGSISHRLKVLYATKLHRLIDGEDRPIGPLGFWDGISQPQTDNLFEQSATVDPWLHQLIGEKHYGSTLSFLNFKVNRQAFNGTVRSIAADLFARATTAKQGPQAFNQADFEDEVAAILMGRHFDGKPRTRDFAERKHLEIEAWQDNNWHFSQTGDEQNDQRYCPYMAHVRAVNPRTQPSPHPRIIRRGMLSYYPDDTLEENRGTTGDALYFMSYQADLRTLQHAFDLIKQNRDIIVYNQKDTIVEPYEFSVIINGELFNFKRTANDFNFVQLEAENYFYVPPRVFFQKLNSLLID